MAFTNGLRWCTERVATEATTRNVRDQIAQAGWSLGVNVSWLRRRADRFDGKRTSGSVGGSLAVPQSRLWGFPQPRDLPRTLGSCSRSQLAGQARRSHAALRPKDRIRSHGQSANPPGWLTGPAPGGHSHGRLKQRDGSVLQDGELHQTHGSGGCNCREEGLCQRWFHFGGERHSRQVLALTVPVPARGPREARSKQFMR
jgi:hypothetical protein